jgi:hypothetical protein
VIDGTCYAIHAELLARVGPLDSENFGRRGWGATEDYILRIRALGGSVLVTHRAYLEHSRGATAHDTMSSYERYASSEMRRGLQRKYGRHWRRHFANMSDVPDGVSRMAVDYMRDTALRFQAHVPAKLRARR